MGVKIKIMLPYDPHGKVGCKIPIPDNVVVRDPKNYDDEEEIRSAKPEMRDEVNKDQETA